MRCSRHQVLPANQVLGTFSRGREFTLFKINTMRCCSTPNPPSLHLKTKNPGPHSPMTKVPKVGMNFGFASLPAYRPRIYGKGHTIVETASLTGCSSLVTEMAQSQRPFDCNRIASHLLCLLRLILQQRRSLRGCQLVFRVHKHLNIVHGL